VLTRLKAADIVIFTGGDQLRLTSTLRNCISRYLLDKYQNEEFVYAGTSCAAASNNISRKQFRRLLKGEVKITSGLGLIDGVIIDTHFVREEE
jgi:cyanophycinase